jgi:membrane protease YdiL (CAAX protease family)
MNMKQIFKYTLLILYCIFPAIVSLVAVNLELLPAISYAVGKVLMLALPLIVWRLSKLDRREISIQAGLVKTNLLPGMLLGLLFAVIILGSYFGLFINWIKPAQVVEKLTSLGLLNHYWLAAAFFSLGNAFLEEYYFRAFLIERFTRFTSNAMLIAIANGLVFGLHHFVVLLTLVPLHQEIFFASATAAAGFVWAYMRARGFSILDCYVSHVWADLAIFVAGWHIITGFVQG